jgi:hypothetical protein
MRGFLQGVIGGVVATALIVGGTVLAGSGVGGVFNLGVSNTVTSTTRLGGGVAGKAALAVSNPSTGAGSMAIRGDAAADFPAVYGSSTGSGAGVQGVSAKGPGVSAVGKSATAAAARVANTGGGPGIRIETTGGAAPLSVNSAARVVNLNADLLDGYDATQLGRVSMANSTSLFNPTTTTVLATVTINVPKQGFVMVQGYAYADDAGCACTAQLWLRDDSTTTYSPGTAAETTNLGYASLSLGWIFPASPGSHSYSLVGLVDGSGLFLRNPVITALFVPFGAYGSPTTLAKKGSLERPAGHPQIITKAKKAPNQGR